MTRFKYEIESIPDELGGGWRLRLMEKGEEVGGGVFPPVQGIEPESASQQAFFDALEVAQDWLTSR